MQTKKLLWLLPMLVLAACGHSGSGGYENASIIPATESNKSDTTAAIAANAPINSPERKIIHTADFTCQVRDVFAATTALENLVKSAGGIVQESHIDNAVYEKQTSYYTADSLRETTTYTTTSKLTLRVPVAYMDSVVKAIPALSSFIDSRTLKQNDVTYQYLSNVLKNQVGTNNGLTGKIMQPAKKGREPLSVQYYDDSKQEQRIDRKIENMNLSENVAYATLTVAFSQPEQVYIHNIANAAHMAKTPLLIQCKSAIYSGWEMLMSIFILLIRLWPLMLVGLIAALLYKRLFRRNLSLAKK
jgi:hypothetical protein